MPFSLSVFGEMYDAVYVVESDDSGTKSQLSYQASGKDLDEYSEERAGLVDLLNDGKCKLQGQPLVVQIDFKVLEQAENASAKQPFPRKSRPST